MKNSHQTARQNFLKKQNLSGNLSMLFALFLTVVPLLMALQFFSQTGITTLSCQQTKLTQVQCEVNRSKYLGLIEQPPTYLTKVKSAKFDYQNSKDSSGESTVDYLVTLVNQNDKEVIIFQDLMFINGVRGNMEEMEAIAQEINRFINNPTQSFLTISRDLRWRSENLVPFSIVILFITLGIFLCLRKFAKKNSLTKL
ncbi:MAG: hypothetical protein WBA93_13320 [Microcoleaceae cyanobacterium]